MKIRKYWYFRFTDNFLYTSEMRNMKAIPMYGYKFIVIYLELCQLAIPNGGVIEIQLNEIRESYITRLAKDIGENIEDVEYAISYFLKNGFIEECLNEELNVNLLIPNLENKIGKGSNDSDRKKLSANNILPENKKLLESDKDNNKSLGAFKNVFLSENEIVDLKNKYANNYDKLILNYSTYKHIKRISISNDYKEIIKYIKEVWNEKLLSGKL